MAGLLLGAAPAAAHGGRVARPGWHLLAHVRYAALPQETALEPGSGALLMPALRKGIVRISRNGQRRLIAMPTVRGSISAPAAADIWATGATAIEHWNGHRVHSFPLPEGIDTSAPVLVSAAHARFRDVVWMAGFQRGRYVLARLAHGAWHGRRTAGWVSALDVTGPRDAWAATRDGLLHWDGQRWSRLPGTAGIAYTGVREFRNGITWAVGERGPADPVAGWIDGRGYHPAGRGLLTTPPGVTGSADDVWTMGTNEVHRWPEWETQLFPARAVLLQARPDGSLLALASDAHGARVLQLRPVQISESGFGSPLARVRLGGEMGWHVRGNARQRHGVWTLQALHLLPTVTYAPGQDVFWAFSAAGTYPLTDPSNGARARVEVPLRLTLSGRLQLGIGTSPGGLVYQVQIRRPSGQRFRPWLSTTSPRVDLPSAPGTYEFRARLLKLRTGAHTGWSPVRRVTVD